MVIKNIHSSNCNILIKVVQQLRHASYVSLKINSDRFIFGLKCCCTHIFLSKYTLKATTNDKNLTTK